MGINPEQIDVKQTVKNMAFNSKTAAAAGKKSTRKGKPNKTTGQIRALVVDLLEQNAVQIQKDIEALEPKDRVNTWLKLLEFYLPKPRENESDNDTQRTYTPTIVFVDTPNTAG